MLDSSLVQILNRVDGTDVVLDVGGWIKPMARADWVIDVMPHASRAQHGLTGEGPERFSERTWIQRDVCAREPWPFEDEQFDFVVCSHTLEDVRDPVWVCSELNRVAKAGYIEVPSRLEEQTHWVQGPWVGWGHHHWLVEVLDGRIEFVFKTDVVHGDARHHFPPDFLSLLSPEDRVQTLWWEGSFDFGERLLLSADEVDPYLADFVARESRRFGWDQQPRPRLKALANRVRRRLSRR